MDGTKDHICGICMKHIDYPSTTGIVGGLVRGKKEDEIEVMEILGLYQVNTLLEDKDQKKALLDKAQNLLQSPAAANEPWYLKP